MSQAKGNYGYTLGPKNKLPARGLVFLISCKHCKRPIDISILAIGPDDEIYCQICCNKISWPGNYAGSSDTTLIAGDEGEPTNCPRCGGKV